MSLADLLSSPFFGRVVARVRDGGATITVREKRGERALYYNSVVLSRLRLGAVYTGSYWDYFLPLPSLYKNPRVLVIGLGGGTIPYQIRKTYGKAPLIDVVEISKPIIDLSKKFLPERLDADVINGDGIRFIEGAPPSSYDVIIVDPYTEYSLNKEFVGEGFANAARRALSDEGVLAFNFILTDKNIKLWRSYGRPVRRGFSVYTMGAPPRSGNALMVCSKKLTDIEISHRAESVFHENEGMRRVLDEYAAMQRIAESYY